MIAGNNPQSSSRASAASIIRVAPHQQFVGDRVQHPAEIGLLAQRPRQVAIEPIGDGRRRENDRRREIGARRAERHEQDQQGGWPQCGESVRTFGRSVIIARDV